MDQLDDWRCQPLSVPISNVDVSPIKGPIDHFTTKEVELSWDVVVELEIRRQENFWDHEKACWLFPKEDQQA